MKYGMPISITSRAQLAGLAGQLARRLQPGDHLGLIGPLGAGKTTFTVSLAAALGCSTIPASPTFTLRQTHACQSAHGITNLVHIDLYRLTERAPIAELGLEDDFRTPGTLLVIEWVDRAPELTPRLRYQLTFNWDPITDRRQLIIKDNSL